MLNVALALVLNQTNTAHTFEYVADADYKSVTVAGTFNGWNKEANPMKQQGRKWLCTINIPLGKHQYKFVRNGDDWILDPKNPTIEDDGNGHQNSVLVSLPNDYSVAAKVGDGIITRSVLKHVQQVPFVNFDQGKMTVRLTARPGDIQSLKVIADGKNFPMHLLSSDTVLATYEASVLPAKSYSFHLTDGSTKVVLGPFKSSAVKPFIVPAWVEGTVFYQIFPDRFANGDKKNDPKEVMKWSDTPTWFNRFGGDATGIKQHAGYLSALGVNGIYINPIMSAPSNHRYDPVDFYNVDMEFGTNKEFADLTHELDRRGIRVVLDQIFDHVGVTFPPFADVLHFQEKSRYLDWFTIKRFPVKVEPNPPYEAWWGYESMPKIRVMQPDAKNYLLGSVDFWMKNAKLSGWRLDVANEVPYEFWREFRQRVKRNNPDAWIVGEVWDNASAWLSGDQWDASMNYPFRFASIDWIAKGQGTATGYIKRLKSVYDWYAPQVSRNQLNLLSSHDTPRFISDAGGDRKLMALAAIMQFTWPGAPSVYYGEELGMQGGADPANRGAMEWQLATPKNELLRLYKTLTYFRTHSKVLAKGAPVILPCKDEQSVAIFGRKYEQDHAITAINRSEKGFTGLIDVLGKNTDYIDVLTGQQVRSDANSRVKLTLSAKTGWIGVPASAANRALIKSALTRSKI